MKSTYSLCSQIIIMKCIQCTGTTMKGEQCKRFIKSGNVCMSHFDGECPICLSDEKNDIIKTKCGHFFHQYCIQEWYKENLTCPICRDYITKRASFQLDVVFSFHTYSVQIQVPTRHANDVDYVVSKLYKEVFVHNEISTLLNHNEYTLKIKRI